MNNSPPWSKLFSTELNSERYYHLILTPTQKSNCVIATLWLFWGLLWVLLVRDYLNVFSFSFYLSAIATLIIALVFSRQSQTPCRQIIVNATGALSLVYASGQRSPRYQLTSASLITWFGCWLVCQASTEQHSTVNKGKKKRLFVAKQAFSESDYRRLCRIINYLKYAAGSETKRKY